MSQNGIEVSICYDELSFLDEFADAVHPADVGLQEENPDDDRGLGFFRLDNLNRVSRWTQPITYLNVYEGDTFTVSI